MMRGNRMFIIVAATVVMAVAAAIFYWSPWADSGFPDGEKGLHRRKHSASPATVKGPMRAGHKSYGEKVEPSIDGFSELPPKDRSLAEAVQSALDNDDYDATIKAATKALNSTNASVRLHAVEALGWFGKKALAELTPCMADPDEEVAQAAVNAWEMGLSEIDSAKDRFDFSLMALTTISEKDALFNPTPWQHFHDLYPPGGPSSDTVTTVLSRTVSAPSHSDQKSDKV